MARYPTMPDPGSDQTGARDLIAHAVRKRVIKHIATARQADNLREPNSGLTDEEWSLKKLASNDPTYTEEQFIMIELLGHNPNNVDVELIYSFLKHIGAERVRPNTFIHQWAVWREFRRRHIALGGQFPIKD